MNGDDWSAWGKHVLAELERNEADHKMQMSKIDDLRNDVAMLKVKAGLWGALGGLAPALIAFIFWAIKSTPTP